MLELPADAAESIVAAAVAGYPYEVCGLLAGAPGGSTVARYYPCRNAAESARVYTLDPLDHLRAERDAEADGLEIIGVLHSHTHTEAVPSPTDVAEAPDPSWHYVIVSLRGDEPVLRSWRIAAGVANEEPLSIRSG